ncbi:MAG: alpha-hydroxy-acid oxidizing protein [Alphaproteobacteria bacterium]|jgi:isopentenyl diphosphate isomerase/L-lactate dehydrogenase-like FMN-dependent dehydrogenase|nr:alpha-hydroxy-acid oxidizing protein [Alphaproteobacteria bacterium]
MADLSRQALNIEDLRHMAKRRLTKALFDFCDKGSEDQIAMRDNRAALDRIKLRPRVLRNTSERHARSSILGKQHDLPILIGPTGPAGFVWYRGETELARAAAKANIPFTLASTSNTAMEKVYANGGGTQWFQLYVWRDPEAAFVTIQRALDAGFEALVVTVDSPVYNNREIDVRNGLVFPPKVTLQTAVDSLKHPRWLLGTAARYYMAEGKLPAFSNIHVPEEAKADATGYVSAKSKSFLNRDDTMDYDYLRRIRDMWPHKLLVKGILHPDDAVMVADAGADGIFVSNHAGNTNDTAVTPWDALPAIVEAAGDKLTIIADSGVRRGSDVLKALALGADAVAIGRATLYGVGAAGEAGAARAIEILESEILRTMAVLGVTDIPSIGREQILLPSELPVSGTGIS